MFNFINLSDDLQVMLFLLMAEEASQYLRGEDSVKKAKQVIGECWRWIEKKRLQEMNYMN